MSDAQAIARLKSDWKAAKQAADSLFVDFKDIEVLRKREVQARNLYREALRPSVVQSDLTSERARSDWA